MIGGDGSISVAAIYAGIPWFLQCHVEISIHLAWSILNCKTCKCMFTRCQHVFFKSAAAFSSCIRVHNSILSWWTTDLVMCFYNISTRRVSCDLEKIEKPHTTFNTVALLVIGLLVEAVRLFVVYFLSTYCCISIKQSKFDSLRVRFRARLIDST